MRAPHDGAGRFVNWSGEVTSQMTSWYEPTKQGDIAALVRRTYLANGRIHVVGGGHSWSPIAAPDQAGMSLDGWNGVTDQTADTVTVRAGTRLRDLNKELAIRGLALPILGSIDHQSVAGAIATGTHGSSLSHGNLATLVQGVRLITGTGEVLNLDATDPRLEGVRVHLGALGVLTHVTLRVEPAFRLAETIEQVPVGNVAAEVEAIGRSAEYVKVWWLPHTSHALVYRYMRTDEATSRRPPPAAERWVDANVVHKAVLPALFAVNERRPHQIPTTNRLLVRTLDKPRRVGPSTMLLSTPMPVHHAETEAAVPLAQGGEAFDRLVRLIDAERLQVNFIAELRFVRGDTNWMSPASGGDTVQLGAYTALRSQQERYFAAFWREMRELGARPHWGKQMDHSGAEIRRLYPAAERFVALRDELDPARVFANPFLDRVLAG